MSGRMLYVDLSEVGQKTLQELLDMSPSTDIRSLFEDALIHFAALKQAQRNGVAWVSGATAAVNPDNDDSEESVVLDIPSVFQLQAQNTVAKKSEIMMIQGKAASPFVADWISGLRNRVLPVKAVCRSLMNVNNLCSDVKFLYQAGVKLRSFLATQDRQLKLCRDEAFATGFPHLEKGSKYRYIFHFIKGLAVDYGLVEVNGSKVKLTDLGRDFAQMPNPVLDGKVFHERLSNEEIEFLLEIIEKRIPIERIAFQRILAGLHQNINTPKDMDLFLAKEDAQRQDGPLPKKYKVSQFLCSQRAAVISRMEELKLVQRLTEGRNVSYRILERGQRFTKA